MNRFHTFRVEFPTMRDCSCCESDHLSLQRLTRVVTGERDQGYETVALHETYHCRRCDLMEVS